jgi:hypothetical protein
MGETDPSGASLSAAEASADALPGSHAGLPSSAFLGGVGGGGQLGASRGALRWRDLLADRQRADPSLPPRSREVSKTGLWRSAAELLYPLTHGEAGGNEPAGKRTSGSPARTLAAARKAATKYL